MLHSDQKTLSTEVIDFLEKQFPFSNCSLSGSFSQNTYDQYSDIDIIFDVSGKDNGKYLLMLPPLFQKHFPVLYFAFAPKFAPTEYVFSFGLENANPFHFIDIVCFASPHIASISKDEITQINNPFSLAQKIIIMLLKQFIRKKQFSGEQQFLARLLNIDISLDAKDFLLLGFKEIQRHLNEKQNLNIRKCIELIQ